MGLGKPVELTIGRTAFNGGGYSAMLRRYTSYWNASKDEIEEMRRGEYSRHYLGVTISDSIDQVLGILETECDGTNTRFLDITTRRDFMPLKHQCLISVFEPDAFLNYKKKGLLEHGWPELSKEEREQFQELLEGRLRDQYPHIRIDMNKGVVQGY